MKSKFIANSVLYLMVLILTGCSARKHQVSNNVITYIPSSIALHDTIARMDSVLFEAYNHCKTDVFEALIADDIEFYHDQGGLTTSKEQLIEALKNNICNKVTRELLAGSIEVYPIPDYGAVQMGAHRFINKLEDSSMPSRFSKFVHTWKRENGEWRLARVISLH